MKKIYKPEKEKWSEILKRPTQTLVEIEDVVVSIFKDIELNGDEAVKKYTEKFDKIRLNDFMVTKEEIGFAEENLENDLKEAINIAKNNIEIFHRSQITNPQKVETTNGVVCWQNKKPIEKVGLYIPGGTAPLFSTILMLAVPAQIAGCKEIILCTPPNQKGEINPAILYTAKLCGVDKIFKVGGIQAIAAFAFGTESIPRVHKIFGPGNQFVTVSKQIASNYGVAIDLPAGPSELLVMADETANAKFVASDLLSQAEHGADSQVILVSTNKEFLLKVENEVNEQIKFLPRKSIAEIAISNSKLIFCESKEIANELINEYAPEHYIISTKDDQYFIDNIINAGSVFIGSYTPESAGDYASGTNHTLPTNGFAKAYSGVNLDSFLKAVTFQKISKTGLKNIGKSIEIMAEAEGLQAHKNAVSLRLKELE